MKYYLATRNDSSLVNIDVRFQEWFASANCRIYDRVIVSCPNEADIIVLFEAFSFKLRAYAHELAECPFIREYADRIYTVNYDDSCAAFLPGCYTSLTPRIYASEFHHPCAYPKMHNLLIDRQAADMSRRDPQVLCSFRGNCRAQAIRRQLARSLAGQRGFCIVDPETEFHDYTHGQQRAYLDDIANSLFVLCPKGASPATYRLFEVMQMGRCPVILSDDWIPIPGIDWLKCSLRVSESNVDQLPEILKSSQSRARELGHRARAVWEQCFSQERKFQLYANSIERLHARRVPGGIKKLERLWNSQEFLEKRGWTMSQRLSRGVFRLLGAKEARSEPDRAN